MAIASEFCKAVTLQIQMSRLVNLVISQHIFLIQSARVLQAAIQSARVLRATIPSLYHKMAMKH